MNLKNKVLLVAVLFGGFWFSNFVGGFFGYTSLQGLAGSAVVYVGMAVSYVWVQKKLRTGTS